MTTTPTIGTNAGDKHASPKTQHPGPSDDAPDTRAVDEAITRYIRPDTFPVAVRMLEPDEPLPDRVRVPSESMGEQWIVCQSIGVARRYGWSVAVGRDDVVCPLAAVAFGLREPNDTYLSGYAAQGMFCEDGDAAAALEADVWRFEPGRYDRVCVAPLSKATFTPHVVATYGNSAQVMRLVNAALFEHGGHIESSTSGRLDCSEIVIQTMRSGEPKVVLPCNGDRIFGMAQDTEMAFAFPWGYAGSILAGLQGTHKGGVRYPIPVSMRRTPDMPKKYDELLATLDDAPAGSAATRAGG
jgi:uncharacterized protein (DUF169 family)